MSRGKKRFQKYNRFLGIDESNSGKIPVIYSGILTDNRNESRKKRNKKGGHLSKKRIYSDIFDVLEDKKFRYVIFGKNEIETFGRENLLLIASTEFIRFFTKSFGDLELVILDGKVSKKNIEKLEKILYPGPVPKIIAEKNADVNYPLVNLADYVSRLLFWQIRDSEKINKEYLDYQITPKYEDYPALRKDVMLDC